MPCVDVDVPRTTAIGAALERIDDWALGGAPAGLRFTWEKLSSAVPRFTDPRVGRIGLASLIAAAIVAAAMEHARLRTSVGLARARSPRIG
jgi:hypothetical protein